MSESQSHCESPPTVIIGGGPAGLTSAHELTQHGHPALVLEASDHVGGIARTESYKGYRFDIGGHRFFTKVPQVEKLWRDVLGDDFIRVSRLSRIYYQGKFYQYPLKLGNALTNLGVYESVRILLSYFKWQLRPHNEEENFEKWVINRFGGRLYWHFFRTYTEKVWGISCREIRSDWAAQRIKNLSLRKAVVNAITGSNDTTSLIESFEYPKLGPGMMWERFRDIVRQRGGSVWMNSPVTAVHREGSRVVAVTVEPQGQPPRRLEASQYISTMPLRTLIRKIDPPPPSAVRDAAERLKYRDFLIVGLILAKADPFPDNWIYIHSPHVKVGRIQNFRSWSRRMVPDPDRASIGMEYFCQQGDGLWTSDEATLVRQAGEELVSLGLAKPEDIVDGTVIRQPKAYPVYDQHYRDAVETIRQYLHSLENFQSVGRNGMHRYNNQDHSMLTAILAARNVLGGNHDPWEVNLERSYQEDFVTDKSRDAPAVNG